MTGTMNLRQLEYFVQVAELGSFSRAARLLGLAQPALSRQVRALETDLRETLLLRNGRGVELTDAGRRLFEHAIAILQHVAHARDDMGAQRDEPVGRIVVGLPPSLGRQLTRPLIDAFHSQLPRARLAIVEGLTAHIAEWIATGRVDLALLHNPDAAPELDIVPVLEEMLCLVQPAVPRRAGKRSPPRERTPLPLAQLSSFPLVVPDRMHALRRLTETQAALAGVQLDIAWEVSSVPSIIDLVAAGYGNAVLPRSAVAASGRAAQLTMRPLGDPPLYSVLCMAASAHRRATPLAKRVAGLLRELAVAVDG
ncbi:MAG: LysR substrate-binding domain-containing protein [Burkholderiaceae bacterium]|nr:LysR substrate-binding domain-containing protein [Burkholderiaceae bacterium]